MKLQFTIYKQFTFEMFYNNNNNKHCNPYETVCTKHKSNTQHNTTQKVMIMKKLK